MYAPYTPATRLLSALELLQAQPGISAERLAERLEVNTRSVRRYITMLQQMNIPIEAEHGRYGGYRLRPGFKLPPLMLSDDEAVAVTLGLLAAQKLQLAGTVPEVEGALTKIERVLPATIRARVQALRAAVELEFAPAEAATTSHLLTCSMAAHTEHRLHLRYQSGDSGPTERDIDCYGLAYYEKRWYVVGYCHLRQDMRIFRLDRVLTATLREATFTRPLDFDCLAFAIARFAAIPDPWLIEVLLEISIDKIREAVPPTFATLEETADGTLLRAYDKSLDNAARFLVGLGVRFHIHQPAELRARLRHLADELLQIAGEGKKQDP